MTEFKKLENIEYQPIKNNIPIDFVYSYLDSNDEEHTKKLKYWYEVEGKNFVDKKRNFKDRYTDFDELHFSLMFLNKYMSWIRNIYIVTPTPKRIKEIYKNNPKIKIITDDELLPEGITKPNFRSTVIESFIYLIPGLSELFFYSCDDMFVGNYVKREELFSPEGIPWAHLEKFDLNNFYDERHKSAPFRMDVINSNLLILNNFDINPKYCHNHQMVLVRKEACIKTHQLYYKEIINNGLYRFRSPTDYNLHFILLQHLVGILYGYYKVYDLEEKEIIYGFYPYNQFNPWKRFSTIIKFHPKFFCLNYIQPQFMIYVMYMLLQYNNNFMDRKKKFIICYKDDNLLNNMTLQMIIYLKSFGEVTLGKIDSLPRYLCNYELKNKDIHTSKFEKGEIEWKNMELIKQEEIDLYKIIFLFDEKNPLKKFRGNENYDIMLVNPVYFEHIIPEISFFSSINSEYIMNKKDNKFFKKNYIEVLDKMFNIIYRKDKGFNLKEFGKYPRDIVEQFSIFYSD